MKIKEHEGPCFDFHLNVLFTSPQKIMLPKFLLSLKIH
jgi:hypothetical protein